MYMGGKRESVVVTYIKEQRKGYSCTWERWRKEGERSTMIVFANYASGVVDTYREKEKLRVGNSLHWIKRS